MCGHIRSLLERQNTTMAIENRNHPENVNFKPKAEQAAQKGPWNSSKRLELLTHGSQRIQQRSLENEGVDKPKWLQKPRKECYQDSDGVCWYKENESNISTFSPMYTPPSESNRLITSRPSPTRVVRNPSPRISQWQRYRP
jgi:hypothetical protein